MNVWTTRQQIRIYLHDGADEHDVPLGVSIRHQRNGDRIESLVDDAKEAESWMRDRALLGVVDGRVAGLRKVICFDAAGEAVHIGVQRLLGAIEAQTTREHDVGHLEEGLLAMQQVRRRTLKRG